VKIDLEKIKADLAAAGAKERAGSRAGSRP